MRTYWIVGEVEDRRQRPQFPGRSPSVRWVRSACNSLRNQASEPSVGRLREKHRQQTMAPQTPHQATTTLWRRGHSCPSLEEPDPKTSPGNGGGGDCAGSRISSEDSVPAERQPLLKLNTTTRATDNIESDLGGHQ
ncbi:unnamed protein product [Ixodes persulcatus]